MQTLCIHMYPAEDRPLVFCHGVGILAWPSKQNCYYYDDYYISSTIVIIIIIIIIMIIIIMSSSSSRTHVFVKRCVG